MCVCVCVCVCVYVSLLEFGAPERRSGLGLHARPESDFGSPNSEYVCDPALGFVACMPWYDQYEALRELVRRAWRTDRRPLAGDSVAALAAVLSIVW